MRKSNNPQVAELTKSHRERSVNLGDLKAVKVGDIRHCAWCAEAKLRHGNQKYCSTECSNSAMAWAYPQKEDALRFLLLRQGWKCLLCQYDYKPWMDKILARDMKMYPTLTDFNKTPWYYFKRLKSSVPKERKPEVDHIIPIYKGGTSLGLDNHQAICYTCHKTKTSKDLKKSKSGEGQGSSE